MLNIERKLNVLLLEFSKLTVVRTVVSCIVELSSLKTCKINLFLLAIQVNFIEESADT